MNKHKHVDNQNDFKEHKHAHLLRLAADNVDQLFECDEITGLFSIYMVLRYTQYNWRPIKLEPKKIKRWLWADKEGNVYLKMLTDEELDTLNSSFLILDDYYLTKLLWSETEFDE